MTHRPILSIITVSYNSEKTIKDTILSVLNQTYSSIEYIIIDGGSKDRTLPIIKSYEQLFAERGIRFTYVSEPDKGIYDAMNKGLNIAAGDWIGIINSDDYYELNAIQLVSGFVNSHPDKELIHGNLNFLDTVNGNKIQKPHKQLSLLTQTMTTFHPTIFIKKTIYEKYGRFDLSYKLCADWEFILRLYKAGVKFGYIDEVLANFRLGGAGSGFKYIHLKERYSIRHKYVKMPLLWSDLKDLLIFAYFKLNPGKSSF